MQLFVAGLHGPQHQLVVAVTDKVDALGQLVVEPAVQEVVAVLVSAVIALEQVVVDRVGAVRRQLVYALLADLLIAGKRFAVGLLRGPQLLAQLAPVRLKHQLILDLAVDALNATAHGVLVGQRHGNIGFDPGKFGAQLRFGILACLQLQQGVLVQGRSMFEL
ncbi:hypothetical protein D9M71_408910 [compost metagenome]